MIIEQGKYYRTRDGRKVGPIEKHHGDSEYPWKAPFEGGTQLWDKNGIRYNTELISDKRNTDLVEEWEDKQEVKKESYNNGSWHPWLGGECPVHSESLVEVMLDDGETGVCKAGGWRWDVGTNPSPIVAFRVTKEYIEKKEPREFWLCKAHHYSSYDTIYHKPNPAWWFEVVHVTEVLEE